MNLTVKNLREKEFHNKLQSSSKGRFENIFYKAIGHAWLDYYENLNSLAKNSDILDYGCGTGPTIEKVINYNPKKITFDLVYGLGILHHLEFSKCMDEISRILKTNGSLLFIEPLGTNPIINLYRFVTPGSRSKDEHPLTFKDFDLIKEKFKNVSIKYYGFMTLVFFPFYKSTNSRIFKALIKFDQFLFKIKFLRLFAWSVLITAKKN